MSRERRRKLSDEARADLALASEIMDEAGIPKIFDNRPQPRMSAEQANGLDLILGFLLAPAREELGLDKKPKKKSK